MFKNIKIATGLNALMIVFIVFMTILSLLNFSSSRRFTSELSQAVQISNASDPLGDALNRISNAAALIGVAINTNKSDDHNAGHNTVHNTGHNTEYDSEYNISDDVISNVNKLTTEANRLFKIFTDLPTYSPAEQAEKQKAVKVYDDLLAYTTKGRNAITRHTENALNHEQMNQELERLRVARRTVLEGYRAALIATLDDGIQQADADTTREIIVGTLILLISIGCTFAIRQWLKKELFMRLERTKQTFATIAAGDLSQPINIGTNNEIGEMLAELEKMRQSLTGTVANIRTGITSIYRSAQEISTSNNDLSSRTEQQASALQQTAASMEELKITVRQNADNAHSAKLLVETASNIARKGGDVMVNLDSIMREITENSRQIADINGVIDSIANQTNILALNAAVEAARAGEQGRGFAVVAGEVRSLAKRSADAAKEIRQLINVCVANMNTGSQEVETVGEAMNEVVKSVTQVTDIMAEITSASDEQSTGINQIAQAVNEMDLVTQQNASMVEEAASVAQSVETNARDLEQAVSLFVLPAGSQSEAAYDRKPASSAVLKKPVKRNESAFTKSKAEDDWVSF